jgi:hypothetical protein
MGMDIHGRNPTGERGAYFRNNVWWWHPLADYCITVAPDICEPCKAWHYNEGDGLDAAGAVALADALENEISAKRTVAFERRYTSEREMAPNEPSDICAGTGMRTLGPHRSAGDLKEGGIKCNKCQGAGYVRPWASNYEFSTENVTAFVAFLRDSGGFVIW